VSTPIERQNFEGLPLDINTVGRVYIKELTGDSSYFAEEIAARREPPGRWTSYNSFLADMNQSRIEAKREITEDFKESLKKVREAARNGVIRFGDS